MGNSGGRDESGMSPEPDMSGSALFGGSDCRYCVPWHLEWGGVSLPLSPVFSLW